MFFSTVSDDSSQRVQGIIGAVIDPEPLVVYRSVEALAGRLRQPLLDLDIAVVNLPTRGGIAGPTQAGRTPHRSSDNSQLPDREEDTLGKAHLIRPRFLAYADSHPQYHCSRTGEDTEKALKRPPPSRPTETRTRKLAP